MISRTRGIFSTNLWKPKIIHSLDYLKYLYTVLVKNQNITEQNSDVLVEVFRLVAEILIWGDQNDSSIIDFFLEKNILSLFLKFLNQPNGRMICKQLLQTLSIMFENISDKTSIYYLLSNNHINAIICHKFNFNDEEVMAYYISFLKALSMKLNKHTINFFFNENTNDFALFTESLKFFNQSELMVRTAVRNITLNVYKVADKAMLRYITDKTAIPYFHNIMWCIGNRIIDIDTCLAMEPDSLDCGNRLRAIVDEHLDQLQYINDILSLSVEDLNDVLIETMLNRLHIPLYIYSLSRARSRNIDSSRRPRISKTVSMFMLAQVFSIIKHRNVAQFLAKIILIGDLGILEMDACKRASREQIIERNFEAPVVGLAETLDDIKVDMQSKFRHSKSKTTDDSVKQSENNFTKMPICLASDSVTNSAPVTPRHRTISSNDNSRGASVKEHNIGDLPIIESWSTFSFQNKPFLKTVLQSLEFDDDKVASDYDALIAMCLLLSICQNTGVDESLLNSCGLTTKSSTTSQYNEPLMDRLISLFNLSVKYGSVIRLVTLELACILAEQMLCSRDHCRISDEHFAYILTVFEESKLLLRNYYKSEEVFVNMFEEEYMSVQKRTINLECLLTDHDILLPQMPGIHSDFVKRLPISDTERARYSIRVFLLLNQLCDKFKVDDELNDASGDNSIVTYPGFKRDIVSVGDPLNLATNDLVACTIEYSDKSERRFMVIDEQQIKLVEADSSRPGWGLITFVGSLRHVKIADSRDDNKSLFISVYNNSGAIIGPSRCSTYSSKPALPILAAKFMFDDYNRCLCIKNMIEKGRETAYQEKLQHIAIMLDFPTSVILSIKSGPLNSHNEYRSGYFGPKENASEGIIKSEWEIVNSVPAKTGVDGAVKSMLLDSTTSESSTESELHIDKIYFK